VVGRRAQRPDAVIPQGEPGSSQTVNPGRRDRPLRTPAAKIQLVGIGTHNDVQR